MEKTYHILCWTVLLCAALVLGIPVICFTGLGTLYAQWVLDERNGTAEHPLSSITDTIGYDDRTYYVETGATVDLRGFAEEPEGVYWHDGEGL